MKFMKLGCSFNTHLKETSTQEVVYENKSPT